MLSLLLILLFGSTVAGFWFSRRAETKPVKVMLFVLYFWIAAFIQLVIAALMYQGGLLQGLLD